MPRNSTSQRFRRDWRPYILAGIGALLLIDAAFFIQVFRPAGISFASQQQTLQRLTAEAAAKRVAVEKSKKIEASLEETRKLGNEFYEKQLLPAATGYSTVMAEVDKIAVSAGVRKSTVTYGTRTMKDRPDLRAVEISTTLEGDYGKIVQFVNRLEQSGLFLTVDSMSAGAGSPQTRAVRLGVQLLTYFRVPTA